MQVLGKLRGTITINVGEDKNSVIEKAKNDEKIKAYLDGKQIIKEIYVPNKLLNFVVGK